MAVSNQQILDALYAIAPQFANPDSEALAQYNTLISLLRCQVNENALCCAVLAYAYLLAHMLTIANSPDKGVVSSMSEGDLSISFGVDSSSGYLMATSYGRAYKDLISRQVIGATVTNVPRNINLVNYYGSTCGC